jgi:hypothetical protein
MANDAIGDLVRPIEPKRPSRCQCADTDPNANRYSDANTYFDSHADAYRESYAYDDTNPDSNTNVNGESGSGSDGEPCARVDLYRFDRYLSVDRG